MKREPKLVSSKELPVPEWLAPAREAALALGAWGRIEFERQWRTLTDCCQIAMPVWAEAGPAAGHGAWLAPVQLWQKQAELVMRRGAEWSTHLTEMQIQWAELQREQWMASMRPWLASVGPTQAQEPGDAPAR